MSGNNASNSPVTGTIRGFLTTKFYAGYSYQIFINTYQSVYAKYYRAKSGGSWSSWKRVYDESILTDSSVLSPLASALGAIWRLEYKEFTVNGGSTYDLNMVEGHNCAVCLFVTSQWDIGGMFIYSLPAGPVELIYNTNKEQSAITLNDTSGSMYINHETNSRVVTLGSVVTRNVKMLIFKY